MMMRQITSRVKRTIAENQKLKQKNTKLFVTRLTRFLEKHIPKVAKIDNDLDAAEAAAVLGGLQSGLNELGLKSVVGEIREAYRDELGGLAARFSDVGLETTISSFDKAGVKALIKNDVSRVTKLISPYIDDVGSTLMRAVIAGEKPQVSDILAKTTDVLEYQIETEVNTMLSAFSRTVAANRAEELGLELFLYVGPDDKITRDFCAEVLRREPPIYTREEIGDLDNEQGLDVLTYGGGYNCRHQWTAISEELAKEMGYGEGKQKEEKDAAIDSDSVEPIAKQEQANQSIVEEANDRLSREVFSESNNNTREVAFAIDANGNEILRKVGSFQHVTFDWIEVEKMRGAQLVNHNHPVPFPLSPADTSVLGSAQFKEMRATVKDHPTLGSGEFYVKNLNPSEAWAPSKVKEYIRDHQIYFRDAIEANKDRIRADKSGLLDFNTDIEVINHYQNRLAEKYNLEFGFNKKEWTAENKRSKVKSQKTSSLF